MEPPDEANAQRLKIMWEHLQGQGWGGRGVAEQARWILSNACVKKEYSAVEVAGALQELHLLRPETDFLQSLQKAACLEALSTPHLFAPEAQWSTLQPIREVVEHTVSLPPGSIGGFIGTRGTSLNTMLAEFTGLAEQLEVLSPPKIRLSVSQYRDCCPRKGFKANQGHVHLKVTWQRWERSDAAVSAMKQVTGLAHQIVHKLTECINAHYRRVMRKRAAMRERHAEMRREVGREYHARRRMERLEKRSCADASAARALELPPAGISKAFGGLQRNRKDVAQQRRRAMMHEKRQRMLRAGHELSLFEPSSNQKTGRDHVLQATGCCGTGTARRMLQHLRNCSPLTAEKALDNFTGAGFAKSTTKSTKCTKRCRKSVNRQQARLTAIMSAA
jgi:hypothetical protein